MTDGSGSMPQNASVYLRVEAALLTLLPDAVTPLRFRIFLGYVAVILLGVFGWEQITSAWRYLVTLLAPVTALIGALLALKLSVVIVSLFTLLTSLVKMFFGFLVVVLKPGILKAIFIPQIVTLVGWIHRKSARLQNLVGVVYEKTKLLLDRVVTWWKTQELIDKVLLSGFLIPLLIVLLVVFIIERATAIFAVKKITEQVVQKTTKYVIKNFHRLPLIGAVPSVVAGYTRKITRQDDREDLVKDIKNLGDEFYEPGRPKPFGESPEKSEGKQS